MARRSRQPLLAQLIWGPQKRPFHRSGQVAVMRVSERQPVPYRTLENLLFVALGIILGMSLHMALEGAK